MSEARIRVVLLEDHALTRAGVRAVLAAAGIDVVAEAADGMAGTDAILQQRPDVAVVDIGLPGRDGLAVTKLAKAEAPEIGIVIMTMADLDRNVRAALQAGADAYCVKASAPEILISAVRAVAGGAAYFDPAIARVALRSMQPDEPRVSDGVETLTERELDILRLIAEGRSNAEIAASLYLGLGTVKGHIADILSKLAASDRAQAAVTAYRRGLLN
jgi:DNA-binding NarL/FixJ family response regulator